MIFNIQYMGMDANNIDEKIFKNLDFVAMLKPKNADKKAIMPVPIKNWMKNFLFNVSGATIKDKKIGSIQITIRTTKQIKPAFLPFCLACSITFSPLQYLVYFPLTEVFATVKAYLFCIISL